MADAVERSPELIESLKKRPAALREAGIPFLLGGGLAAGRAAARVDHDIDLIVQAARTPSAPRRRWSRPGMRPEKPPEAWLSRPGTATSSST